MPRPSAVDGHEHVDVVLACCCRRCRRDVVGPGDGGGPEDLSATGGVLFEEEGEIAGGPCGGGVGEGERDRCGIENEVEDVPSGNIYCV